MRSIGHVEQQELIGLGAGNLDALDNDGETALILASRERNMEMVKFLHEAKADLNAYGRYGTALHRAVQNGHTEMLKVMHAVAVCPCAIYEFKRLLGPLMSLTLPAFCCYR